MSIDAAGPKCSCGNIGCWERFASGTALAQEAIRRIKEGEDSSLPQMVEGRLEDITAETVSMAARSGDRLANEVIDRIASYLGTGLASLVNIFNPEVIVIGGGMAKMGERLLGPARSVVQERAFRLPSGVVRIVGAELGDQAGVIGAAIFARERKSPGGRDEDN